MPSRELEELLVANLPLLERLGRAACRGSNMSAEDVEDFLSEVKVKLVDDDYAVLRSFEGRCSMATWLALIVHRQLLDYRSRVWGRFRPSAEAQRLGPLAVRLESLLVRDGKGVAEAVELLRRGGDAIDVAEAEQIASKLPRRAPRPVVVPIEEAEAVGRADTPNPRGRAAAARAVSETMRDAIGELPPQDQTILQFHFAAGYGVAEISRMLGIGQQVLYRRLRRLAALFRERLLAAGIDGDRIRELLDDPGADLDLGLQPETNPSARPSTNDAGIPHD